MYKNIIGFLLLFLFSFSGLTANNLLKKIVPPYWYEGFENEDLQLILYGENIADAEIKMSNKVLILKKVNKVENPNYLFVDVKVNKKGSAEIEIKIDGQTEIVNYEIKARNKSNDHIKGIDPGDFIYLIMPDRFANGDPSNDIIPGMLETSLNRDSMYLRHGGDLKGIEDQLDYLEELGVTALWLNPVLENDQNYWSYHGYAATDYYNVDKRFGGNEAYFDLIMAMKKRGMKMIMDIIHNHCGTNHWLYKDMPMQDWVHQWDTFTRTSYRAPVHFDPYISDKDKNIFLNAWFHPTMPDLNQDNPFVANYIIQNNIWWIETAGIDCFRLDTYAYSSPDFLEKWSERVYAEFENFTAFGETWVHGAATQSYFHGNSILNKKFNSNLNGLTDFQLHYAINDALTKDHGWTEGVNRIYYTLAKDYLYQNPNENVTFLDNHDLSRFYSVIGEDFEKYKTGIVFLMTMRGIPMLYYGTEILLKNFADPDGKVRQDFPGGWKEDKQNKFKASGRNNNENIAFDLVKKLADYRKENDVLSKGKLTHFIPEKNTYVFFRTTEAKKVMVVINFNKESIVLKLDRFDECLKGKRMFKDILNDTELNTNDLKLKPFEAKVFEF